MGVVVDVDAGADDRAFDVGTRHDRPDAEQRPVDVGRLPCRTARDLRRRQRRMARVHRPLVVVEVEHRHGREQVHVGVVVRVERADVTPVALLALVLAGHDVRREVVDVGDALGGERRDDVPTDVGVLVVLAGGRDDVDERLGVEHVVAHARQATGVVTWHRRRRRRLLVKREDLAVGRRLDDAERLRVLVRHRDSRDGDTGTRLDVALDHLARVHPVDVVGPEHRDVIGVLVADEVEVLVDGVGRAGEPVRAAPHLRRHRGDVAAEQRGEPPRLADVTVEAVALVLREHHDLQVPGVGEVREGEVDDAVRAAERHRRLGPIGRERQHALALATGEDDDEDLRFSGHRRNVPHARPGRVPTARPSGLQAAATDECGGVRGRVPSTSPPPATFLAVTCSRFCDRVDRATRRLDG